MEVATAYKVYRGEEKLTENSVYLTRGPDGTVRKADRYEELFGDLLDAKHPTRGFEFKGQWVPYPKYVVTWSALELYTPKDATGLAALRATRERNKAERAEQKWIADNPLLAFGRLDGGEPSVSPETGVSEEGTPRG